jgi:hypothetical protein
VRRGAPHGVVAVLVQPEEAARGVVLCFLISTSKKRRSAKPPLGSAQAVLLSTRAPDALGNRSALPKNAGRVEPRPDGLVRIALKRAYADGTLAVDLDPLSLLCRLAASVPPPRFHTVKYAGVLAPASAWRSRVGARRKPVGQPQAAEAEALVTEEDSVTRYLDKRGVPTAVPERSPSRGPPYWKEHRPAPQSAT